MHVRISGAAGNKGYCSGDFPRQSGRVSRNSAGTKFALPRIREISRTGADLPAPTATRRHDPAGISRARLLSKNVYPWMRMQKISPAHRVPLECAECGWPGTVTVQQTVQGDRAFLVWCCIACNAEWPVRDREDNPRSHKGPQ